MDLPPYVGKPLAEVVEDLKFSMQTLVVVIVDDQEVRSQICWESHASFSVVSLRNSKSFLSLFM